MRRRGRHLPDLDAYHGRARTGPCFVCGVFAGDPAFAGHHVVHEDEDTIAFFNRWPTRRGYTLVSPKRPVEQVTADFSLEEYLELQGVIFRVAEAARGEVGAERMYVMSPGSSQGNAQVHIAPLPPGAPYEEQQFAAVMPGSAGALDMPEYEKAALAARTGRRMGG